jgi:RimJ/RimL family protein N-acetyltransferase
MIDAEQLPSLNGSRLHLRWIERRDAPALFDIFSNREVMRYWSSPAWTEPSQAGVFIEDVHRLFREKSLFQWGVARQEDDLVIGTCTLADIDPQNRRAEIGFALHRDSWGRGYMEEALRVLLRFSFSEMELHRIEADVDPRNEASIKLLERLGFHREGYLRERWLVNGEINDTVFFGLLRREWAD